MIKKSKEKSGKPAMSNREKKKMSKNDIMAAELDEEDEVRSHSTLR